MRKHATAVQHMAAVPPGECAISIITSYELHTGIEKSKIPAKERAKVNLLLQTIHELAFQSAAAEENRAHRPFGISRSADRTLRRSFSPVRHSQFNDLGNVEYQGVQPRARFDLGRLANVTWPRVYDFPFFSAPSAFLLPRAVARARAQRQLRKRLLQGRSDGPPAPDRAGMPPRQGLPLSSRCSASRHLFSRVGRRFSNSRQACSASAGWPRAKCTSIRVRQAR